MVDHVEIFVEKQCSILLKVDEGWEIKNKAINDLIDYIAQYQNERDELIRDAFNPNVFRLLKDPIRIMITDLRSQQVRDTCSLLIILSKVTGDKMKMFLRDAFPTIMDAVKVPNKVMSGFVDECIIEMIKHSAFKSAIPIMVNEVKDSKAKFVREKSLEYLNEILQTWDLVEREVDIIIGAIKIGIEDASVIARETARQAFVELHRKHPRKAEKLKNSLPLALQSKLSKALEGEPTDKLKSASSSPTSRSVDLGRPKTSPTHLQHSRTAPRPSRNSKPTTVKTPASVTRVLFTSSGNSDIKKTSSDDSQTMRNSHDMFSKTLPLPQKGRMMKRASSDEASAIQARIRDSVSRRRSVVPNPFADLTTGEAEHSFMSPIEENFGSATWPGSAASPGSEKLELEIDECDTPEAGNGLYLDDFPASDDEDALPVNTKVIVNNETLSNEFGVIRFVGPVKMDPPQRGTWYGVELTGSSAVGNCNGTKLGEYYFKCPLNKGIFARRSELDIQPATPNSRRSPRFQFPPDYNKAFAAALEENIDSTTAELGSSSGACSYESIPVSKEPEGEPIIELATLREESKRISDAAEVGVAVASSQEVVDSLTGVLKLKLSQMMQLLNSQLEIVKTLESSTNTDVKTVNELKEEVKSICQQETDLIRSFQKKLDNMNS